MISCIKWFNLSLLNCCLTSNYLWASLSWYFWKGKCQSMAHNVCKTVQTVLKCCLKTYSVLMDVSCCPPSYLFFVPLSHEEENQWQRETGNSEQPSLSPYSLLVLLTPRIRIHSISNPPRELSEPTHLMFHPGLWRNGKQ